MSAGRFNSDMKHTHIEYKVFAPYSLGGGSKSGVDENFSQERKRKEAQKGTGQGPDQR